MTRKENTFYRLVQSSGIGSTSQVMKTALVLSGGGARGAYEAGVAEGIVEVLGLSASDRAPFQIFAGSSVGAINVTFLAAHADQGDMAAAQLGDVWRSLRLPTHLRLAGGGALSLLRGAWRRSLLDARPLERLVQDAVPWDRLHANVDQGTVQALVIAALHVASGRTTMFAELGPQTQFRPSRDPRRAASPTRIGPDHVLASAAIPLVFPARRIDGRWYCDGGLRFNTPMAPAIRSGADRLVVVSLLHPGAATAIRPDSERPPSLPFLAGKVLNALLLDPIAYDLHVLERFNGLLTTLEATLDEGELERLAEETRRMRGMAYRRLETLVFQPSVDLGEVAGEHLRHRRGREQLGWLGELLLRRAASKDATWEDDLASYVLFDRAFADQLVDLGRRDALRRSEEVNAFFSA